MVGSTEFINYAAMLDTSDFVEGAALTRKEQSAINKALRVTQTDAEKAAAEMDVLTAAFRKGGGDIAVYNKRMNQLAKELTKEADAAYESARKEIEAQEARRKARLEAERAAVAAKRLAQEDQAVARALKAIETPAQAAAKEIALLTAAKNRDAIGSREYTAAVRNIRNNVRGVGSDIAGQVPIVGGFTSSLANIHPAAVVAVAGLGGLTVAIKAARTAMNTVIEGVKEQTLAMDVQAKAAQKLGLTSNAFQAMALQASHAGISQEKFTTGIQRLVRKVGDANRGVAEQQKVFNELGLNYQNLATMTPEKQFVAVSAAIANMDSHAKRLSATVKIFDTEGADLVRILSQGQKGFDDAAAMAEKFGLTMTDIDAANIAAAVDNVGDLQLSFDGLFRTVAKDVAPSIAAAAKVVTDFVTSAEGAEALEVAMKAGEVAGYSALFVIDGLAVSVAKVVQGATAMEIAFLRAGNQWNALQLARASATGDAEGIQREVAEIAKAEAEIAKLSETYQKLGNMQFGDLIRKFEEARFEVKKNSEAAAADAERMRQNIFGIDGDTMDMNFAIRPKVEFDAGGFDAFEMAAKATVDRTKASMDTIGDVSIFDNFDKQFKDFERAADSVFRATRTDAEKYQEKIDELNNLKAFNLIDQDTFDRAVKQADEALAKTKAKAETPLKLSMNNDAAIKGSAEAAARVDQYADRLRRIKELQNAKPPQPPQQQPVPQTIAAPSPIIGQPEPITIAAPPMQVDAATAMQQLESTLGKGISSGLDMKPIELEPKPMPEPKKQEAPKQKQESKRVEQLLEMLIKAVNSKEEFLINEAA